MGASWDPRDLEQRSAIRVCGYLTWTELSGKALGLPVSLSHLLLEDLSLAMLIVILGEEVLEVLIE